MKRHFVFAIFALIFLVVGLVPHSVFAAQIGEPCVVGQNVCQPPSQCIDGTCRGTLEGGPESAADVYAIFGRVANLFFVFFIALSVILFIWAGFLFISGGGDPKKIQEAKDRIVWGVIGLAVAMLAAFIPSLVQDILKTTR